METAIEELQTLLEGLEREQKQAPAQLKAAIMAVDLDRGAMLLARWRLLPLVILACRSELAQLMLPAEEAQHAAELATLNTAALAARSETNRLRAIWQNAEDALNRETPANPGRYAPALAARDTAQENYEMASRAEAQAWKAVKEAGTRHLETWVDPAAIERQLDAAMRELLGGG
jgi:hypothetical protein